MQEEEEEDELQEAEEENKDADQLFNQDVNEEEDFEIPAFLRKQKF